MIGCAVNEKIDLFNELFNVVKKIKQHKIRKSKKNFVIISKYYANIDDLKQN